MSTKSITEILPLRLTRKKSKTRN